MDNVVQIADYQKIEDIIRARVGNKFGLIYMDDQNQICALVSAELTSMELVYFADTLNKMSHES